jgi:hypothetical protein
MAARIMAMVNIMGTRPINIKKCAVRNLRLADIVTSHRDFSLLINPIVKTNITEESLRGFLSVSLSETPAERVDCSMEELRLFVDQTCACR